MGFWAFFQIIRVKSSELFSSLWIQGYSVDPYVLRRNSSSESSRHSSCHPLKSFHNLTVYNHKFMGVQSFSSFPLFVLPGVAISWGQLMLNTRSDDAQSPSNPPADCQCLPLRKRINHRFQQESLPPAELWMVSHCQTGFRVEGMHQPGVHLRTAACTWKRKYLLAFTSIQVWFPEHLHHSECSQRGCWLFLHSNPFL